METTSSATNDPPRARVLFVNRSYWPDAEATGQLLTDLCENLAKEFDVAVIAGQPNQNPDGQAFKRSGTEVRNGVEIHRVFNFRFRKSSFVGRVTNLLSYLFTSTWAGLTAKRPDFVIVQTDPPLLCFLGLLLRWWFQTRLIVYVQDLYPDVALKLGKLRDGWLYRFLWRSMHGTYRKADYCVVLSEDMRDALLASGVRADRIRIIRNWVDTNAVHPVKEDNGFRLRHNLRDDFVVMYSGNLGLTQRLEHLLEAARMLRGTPHLRILIVGDGATRVELVEKAREWQLDNVTFLGYQPKSELAVSLSAADLHFAVLDPVIAECLMPSKLYGILASGTPILSASPEHCEMSRVIRENGVGFVVDFGASESIADRIRYAVEHRDELEAMGRRARQVAVEQYDRSILTGEFGDFLHSVHPSGVEVANSGAS